jgi:hypothetical protein
VITHAPPCGKEGVGGSSPPEGFEFLLLKRCCRCQPSLGHCLLVVWRGTFAREHGGNTSPTTRVHARVTFHSESCLVCGGLVPASAPGHPRERHWKLHGKEGVGGSSPPEGFAKSPANGHMLLPAPTKCARFAGTETGYILDWRALALVRVAQPYPTSHGRSPAHSPRRIEDPPTSELRSGMESPFVRLAIRQHD